MAEKDLIGPEIDASTLLKRIWFKLIEIEKKIALYDVEYKMILDRLNTLNSRIPSQMRVDSVSGPPPQVIKQKQPEPKKMPAIEQRASQPTSSQEFVDTFSTGQYPVTQMLYLNGTKPITLATIEISDTDGKLIKKVKTNGYGRWQVPLPIGKYKLHVQRKFDVDSVDFSQYFDVTPSDKPIVLAPPEAYRRAEIK